LLARPNIIDPDSSLNGRLSLNFIDSVGRG
jgi:hypothetical protein